MALAVAITGLTWGPPQRPPVIHDIGFAVRPGELFAVVGPNGSGKSSLLKCLCRVHPPRAGRVQVGATDVWQVRPQHAARLVAAVLQENPAEFSLSVREVVEMGRTPHHGLFGRARAADEAAVATALAEMELEHLARRPYASLSGGEKQRALLARALAQEPEVLVLDEPTNHLDIRHQLELMDVLRRLGITIIVSMHDLNLAARSCDRLGVLSEGRLVALGRPAEVLDLGLIRQVFGVQARLFPDHDGVPAHIAFQRAVGPSRSTDRSSA